MFEMPNLNQLESRYAMNNLEMNPIMNFASQATDYFVQAYGEKNQIILLMLKSEIEVRHLPESCSLHFF